MKYRVSISFITEREETARKIYKFLSKERGFMRTIRKGEAAEERSHIMLERHYHDEDPTKPCIIIEEDWSE
uniref:Uncharacterized protein n=1 Tax=viral metagenome TaxID=1070528 RepID=A0A6M3XTJ4_9ZZZZ